MTKYFVLVLAVMACANPTDADEVSGIDRFDLWNECEPLDLVVEQLHEAAGEIGLHVELIETLIRSRLRSARIYDTDAINGYVYVRASVTRQVFALELELNKYVSDFASGETGYTATWTTGSFGSHGQDADYILQNLSRHTDKFIDEYLRVNAEAC